MYVISTSYDIEGQTLEVELGCRLVLIALTEEIDSLLALTPVVLDVAQTTYSNCSAAIASAGQYVYQDNTGTLVVGTFFDGDSSSSLVSGEWISILGVTTTSVQPLLGTEAIPDSIDLSYQVPSDGLNQDGQGRIDITETESYYFLRYPATRFVRNGYSRDLSTGEIILKTPVWVNSARYTPAPSSSSSCGNGPSQPGNETGYWSLACLDNWETVQDVLYLPAVGFQTSRTEYDGPGSQVSQVYSEARGPLVEMNEQYYADKYAYCRSLYAVACLPDGNCPIEGMETGLLGYSLTTNYYGDANELVRTIQDNYTTTLSAAQPTDWRSGVNNGAPQNFVSGLSTTDMFRESRVDTTYYQEGTVNVQRVDTYTSNARARGTGLNGDMDALQGIKTVQIRRSSTITTIDVAPDRLNSATTSTKQESTDIRLFSGRYEDTPSEAGPYVLREQIPVPLLLETQNEIQQAVNTYSDYLERFVKGDAFGLQIGEGLREDIASSWNPGVSFRYYDPSSDQVLAMRMDATVWGVDVNESALVTNGVWIGVSNGSVTIPRNLQGNSRPAVDGPSEPAPLPVPPSIEGEDSVDSGTYAWTVDVYFSTGCSADSFGNDGVTPIPPGATDLKVQLMTGISVSGLIVGPGDLIETENNGSIPLESLGNLVVVDATVVNADLFA